MTIRLPLIGVTLDAEPPGGYSQYPWYALRSNYIDAIALAGGLPVALPHLPGLADGTLDVLDGLVVTGGAFDVDPALYGDAACHTSVSLKPGRTAAELALIQGALARNKPVLGICGGHQLLAVALGGQLIQHLPDSFPAGLAHEQTSPRHQPSHRISIEPASFLRRITGVTSMQVNSAHHQAVASPGRYATVNACASDGVIEGLEDSRYRFCLGVQWHPEFLIEPSDSLIFSALVEAARV